LKRVLDEPPAFDADEGFRTHAEAFAFACGWYDSDHPNSPSLKLTQRTSFKMPSLFETVGDHPKSFSAFDESQTK